VPLPPFQCQRTFLANCAMAKRAPVHVAGDHGGLWSEGSVVECCLRSSGCWTVALVHSASMDGHTLTLAIPTQGEVHNEVFSRGDPRLAALGTHERRLPPGFQINPSQSRPGEYSFLDWNTGMKYASPELAWRVHLERLILSSSQPTITDLSGSGSSKHFVWPTAGGGQVKEDSCSATSSSPSLIRRQGEAHQVSNDGMAADISACASRLEHLLRGGVTDGDIEAESRGLAPAPSPTCVPLTRIAETCSQPNDKISLSSAMKNDSEDQVAGLPTSSRHSPTTDQDPVRSDTTSPSWSGSVFSAKQDEQSPVKDHVGQVSMADLVAQPVRSSTMSWERVAQLEGALEQSREHLLALRRQLNAREEEVEALRAESTPGSSPCHQRLAELARLQVELKEKEEQLSSAHRVQRCQEQSLERHLYSRAGRLSGTPRNRKSPPPLPHMHATSESSSLASTGTLPTTPSDRRRSSPRQAMFSGRQHQSSSTGPQHRRRSTSQRANSRSLTPPTPRWRGAGAPGRNTGEVGAILRWRTTYQSSYMPRASV